MPSRRFSRAEGAHARRGGEAPALEPRGAAALEPREAPASEPREAAALESRPAAPDALDPSDAPAPSDARWTFGDAPPQAARDAATVADGEPARRPARLPAPRGGVPRGRT